MAKFDSLLGQMRESDVTNIAGLTGSYAVSGLYALSGSYQSSGLYQASGNYASSGAYQTSGLYQASGVYAPSGAYQASGIYTISGAIWTGSVYGVISGATISYAGSFIGLNGSYSGIVYGRNVPRVYTTASTASLTPEISTYDYFEITALAEDLTINNKSTSAPTGGEKMIIAITSNAGSHALAYGADYVAKGGVALPSATVAAKTTTLGFQWNAGLGKFNLLAADQEA